MEDILAQLIFDYNKNNKNIDDIFVNRIVDIAIKYYEFDDYILKVKKKIFNNSLAYYNYYRKIIKYNPKIINKAFKKRIDFKCYEENNLILPKYLFFLKVLLHELEHVNQYKKINKKNNDIESIILYEDFSKKDGFKIKEQLENKSISVKDYLKETLKLQKIYNVFWEYSPSERLANINATLSTLNVAKLLNDEVSIEFIYDLLICYMLRGFERGLLLNSDFEGPTKYYLDKFDNNDSQDKILKMSKNLNSFDKIKYGLKCDCNDLIFLRKNCEYLKTN